MKVKIRNWSCCNSVILTIEAAIMRKIIVIHNNLIINFLSHFNSKINHPILRSKITIKKANNKYKWINNKKTCLLFLIGLRKHVVAKKLMLLYILLIIIVMYNQPQTLLYLIIILNNNNIFYHIH